MNEWLAACPWSQIVHGVVGASVSIDDMADRPARVLPDDDILDLGGKRIRFIEMPHVPHNWDAGVIFEEETSTLFRGDLFADGGNGPPVTSSDILAPAIAAPSAAMSLTPSTVPTIHRLSQLAPRTLAVMHGSSFTGDAGAALGGLAKHYLSRLRAAVEDLPQ